MTLRYELMRRLSTLSSASRLPLLTYYAYTATTYASFTAAIWILFVRAQGLSFTEVGALNSIWWVALVVSEVPTGYVGDRLGRRNGMLLGTTIIALSTVGMGLSTTFPEFAVVYGTWAVGQTFRSGSDDAWLYDLLGERSQTGDFATIRGRATAIGLAMGAVTAPLGGALADIDFRLPFFATAAVTALGIPILLTVSEHGNREPEAEAETYTVATAVRVIRTQLARPPLRAFVLYFALLFGVLQMTYIFDQPVAQVTALRLGVPESSSRTAVGLVYSGFTLVAALVSYNTGVIEERIGVARWFTVVPVVVGVLFATLWVAPLLAVPVFFVARAVNTASVTLGNQYVNDRVESVGRATVLSAASMVYSLAVIPFELAGGVAADVADPTGALAVFGVVLLVGAGAVWVWERPVQRQREQSA
ncbi:Major Facilitator Superfamily protein [Halogranum rubrum]|uniref:Major Facilitator Superfamily protein n=1 Tax=Halogranum rubrum TaxID=553466 RepID=A0A1I4BYV5_9EURY|nr:MFS transporter [Halogranum rubrum]SFK73101.1 Major Facilitator Superfamily protein [Halogranum rubrum]